MATDYVLARKYADKLIDEYKEANAPVFGVMWDKDSSPTLARVGASKGLVANVGVDDQLVLNDFDYMPIFRDFEEVEDSYGNIFVRIPKFYIGKLDGTDYKFWGVSPYQLEGFYRPWCFWDFTNEVELDYVDIGKYKATSDGSDRLESKPDLYPLISQNIVTFRTRAQNNNTGGLEGYQQLDIHVYDLLQTLMTIEFATLHMQSVMSGFTAGRYSGDDKITADTDPAGNVAVVSNTTGAYYRVGQTVSIGSSLGGNQRFYGRTITQIDTDTPGAGSTTITFDGDPVVLAVDDIIYNTGHKNGFSSDISASSGSLVSNSDGKYPCVYRGIESPYGDIWQFVDGINIDSDVATPEHQTWVCADAEDYASNVFAAPYEQLGYLNNDASEYVKEMGWDENYPFAMISVDADHSGAGASAYYCDYYYVSSSTGARIARVGGYWYSGSAAGPWSWRLGDSSTSSSVLIGGRLVRKVV